MLKYFTMICFFLSTFAFGSFDPSSLDFLEKGDPLEIFTVARVGRGFKEEVLPSLVSEFLVGIISSSLDKVGRLENIIESSKLKLSELRKQRCDFVTKTIAAIAFDEEHPSRKNMRLGINNVTKELKLTSEQFQNLFLDIYETTLDQEFQRKRFEGILPSTVTASFCNNFRTGMHQLFFQADKNKGPRLSNFERTPVLLDDSLLNGLKEFRFTSSTHRLIITMEMLFGFHIPLDEKETAAISKDLCDLSDRKTVIFAHFLEQKEGIMKDRERFNLQGGLEGGKENMPLHFDSNERYKEYLERINNIRENATINIIKSIIHVFHQQKELGNFLKATYKKECDSKMLGNTVYEFGSPQDTSFDDSFTSL